MTETAATKKKAAKKADKKKTIGKSGAELAPSLDGNRPGISRTYAYWIGTLPSAPCEAIEVGGVDFPKMTEKVSGRGQNTVRIPRIGAIRRLSEEQIQRITEKLPNNVVRFTEEPKPPKRYDEDARELVEGQFDGSLEDLQYVRRRGHLVRIPTERDIALGNAEGRTVRRYIAGRYDERAACHMFAQLCDNQDQPQPGASYPPPLSETGIPWPEDPDEE